MTTAPPDVAPPPLPAVPVATAHRSGAAWLVALVVAGAAAVLAGVAFSGSVAPTVLRDPGALVRWGLPVVSTLAEIAGSVALGALVLVLGVLPRRAAAPAGRVETATDGAAGPGGTGGATSAALLVAAVAAGLWTVLGVAQLVLTYANVAGLPVDAPSFGGELGQFVTTFELGRSLLAVTIAAAVVTAASLLIATPTGAGWTALVVLVALWQQAQTGHASEAAGHDLATSSMFAHLVGAALWIGTLAALAAVARRLGRDLGPAVARYSVIAGWCFVAVAVSGVVNAWLRIDGWAGLGTRYGILLLVKIGLFGVLGLLGLAHRRAVIPRLVAGGARPAGGAQPAGGIGRSGGVEAADGTAGRAGWLFWRLVLVELTVMGAVSGVAVALGSTAAPVPESAPSDPTPAEIVTGHPLPPEPTALRWLTEWRWDLLMAFAAAAGIVVYLGWVRRLHRRGDTWPWLRTVSWVTGMLVFGWTTSGGPSAYGHVLFSGHMVQHMILAMVVPIFIVLSAPVTLALRALPARSAALHGDTSRGPREWLLTVVQSHVGRFFANPLVAAVNFAGSMVIFYYTGLFEWSLRSNVGHYAMIVHFSLAGYLFVNALVGVDPGPRRPPYPQRLLLLFATMAFHAFFGVALVSGEALLVADWFGLLGREWGPSAIADQQRGGGVAWGIGELPTLALAIGVAVAWSRDDDRTARRRDRRVDRDGDTEMDEYNAMLARLAERSPER